MLRAVVLLATLLLAGCAGASTDTTPLQAQDGVLPLPEVLEFEVAACETSVTFFLVDRVVASAFLPPGYVPRDLSAFVYNNPATDHEFAMAVALLDCKNSKTDSDDPRFSERNSTKLGLLATFIQKPNVDDLKAQDEVDFDFYVHRFWAAETEYIRQYVNGSAVELALDLLRHETHDDVNGALDDPRLDGVPFWPERLEVTLARSTFVDPAGADGSRQSLFESTIHTAIPVRFEGAPVLKFWHQDPAGVSIIQFGIHDRTTIPAGPALCEIEDEEMREILGKGPLDDGQAAAERPGGDCLPYDSFGLFIAEHDLVGKIMHVPGGVAR